MKKLESLSLAKFDALSKEAMSYTVGGTSVITSLNILQKRQYGASNDLSTDGGTGVIMPGADWEEVKKETPTNTPPVGPGGELPV